MPFPHPGMNALPSVFLSLLIFQAPVSNPGNTPELLQGQVLSPLNFWPTESLLPDSARHSTSLWGEAEALPLTSPTE